MRGKAALAELNRPAERIIPAHAGKRAALWLRWWRNGDHPRSCGEKSTKPSIPSSRAGSSPLMRGKGRLASWYGMLLRDHPRSCGEKACKGIDILKRVGSSPLMRGKVDSDSLALLQDRIIPAHAGKRITWFFSKMKPGDHPRSCGEKWCLNRWIVGV